MQINKTFTSLIAAFISALVICVCASEASALYIDADYVQSAVEAKAIVADHKETQDKAHAMAEIARDIGLDETSGAISDAQQVWAQKAAEISQVSAQTEGLIEFTPHREIHRPTGLSTEGFNRILAGTSMAGSGQAFVDAEKTYSVNGVFMIGIANTESTIGAHCAKNNPYGMLSKGGLIGFDSWYDSTMYLGRLISTRYTSKNTVQAFGSTYCPGNPSWPNSVSSTMTMAYAKLS